MEGPSLQLAAEQLRPFIGQRVLAVSGNTTIGKERLDGEVVRDLFAWGKHLVMQFDGFALRTHFLLFGTYEAEMDGITVTGDYVRARTPRLELRFANGVLREFNCSVVFLETADARSTYDFSIDVLAPAWDPKRALIAMAAQPEELIADVLLDQDVFAGVGNIIKNEVLWLARVHPDTPVGTLTPARRRRIVGLARSFSEQFLAWRRDFVLRKHLHIYNRKVCPRCGGPVPKVITGKRKRKSHFCPHCQPPPGSGKPKRSIS